MSRPAVLFFVLFYSMVSWGQTKTDQELADEALELLNDEEYGKALPVTEELLRRNPDDVAAHYNHAVAAFNLHKFPAALNDYLFLIGVMPENAEFLFQTGNVYEHMDSLRKAVDYYTKALFISNQDFIYFFKRGTVYLKLGWYDDAINDFNQSLRLNEEHHNSLHNRGIAFYKKGEIDLACEDWCQALLRGNPVSASHLDRHCKNYPAACLPPK